MARFETATIATIRRIDKALKHHSSTLQRIHDSGGVLEREVSRLISNRVRRLEAELQQIEADRLAMLEGLGRLGVNLNQSDAKIGRSLRRTLGVTRHDRKPESD